METPKNVFLIAGEECCDGTERILGCVHVDWSGRTIDGNDRRGFVASVTMLSVLEEFRRRGIGGLLVKAAGNLASIPSGMQSCSTNHSLHSNTSSPDPGTLAFTNKGLA